MDQPPVQIDVLQADLLKRSWSGPTKERQEVKFNLWVGNGQVRAGGLLFVGDGASASSSVAAIFDDLQGKGIICPSS